MKVLMFGWEFPPLNQGGLGTACEGLVKSLTKQDTHVTFVLPRPQESMIPKCKIVSPMYKVITISSGMRAYHTAETYYKDVWKPKFNKLYGDNLISEVLRYADSIKDIVEDENFDIIHAHDWLTYKAGIHAKNISGKPLVVHVHATEFDRTGGNGVNQDVYDIEREGMHVADRIIAVSEFTKQKIITHYGIDPAKVSVVHNGVEFTDTYHIEPAKKQNSTVLFLGRLTMQKGPDYFIEAAKKMLHHGVDTTFVMTGSGDMESMLVEKVASWGLGHKILFTGFLRGEAVDKAYKTADLYVMPSISEPFGITPLEAMRNDVPVIISRQSGVSEVVNHCLKVDFWDINEMASKMISVLSYKELHSEMASNGKREVLNLSWDAPAQKCNSIYSSMLQKVIQTHG